MTSVIGIITLRKRHLATIIAFFGIIINDGGGGGGGNRKGGVVAKWTEQDEARRIQQLMEAEELEYELEQSSQSGGSTNLFRENHHHLRHHIPVTESYRHIHATGPPVAVTYPTAAPSAIHDSYWCYHCASPLNVVSGNMRRAIEKFLRIRRTAYPAQVKNARCSEPRNLTELAIERCRHPHCQTLILTDHDTGSAFTMRGCAESFGAINEELLDARGDNTCQRLHEQLDIQECICRYRRYCYPGRERRLYGASAAAAAAALASASQNTVSIFYLLLVICLRFTLS